MHSAFTYAAIIALILLIASTIQKKVQRWRLMKQLGCKSLPAFPILDVFGIREVIAMIKARKANRTLEVFAERFDIVSKHEGREVSTFTFKLLGKTMYMSRDPKVMQAILATQFKDFEFGPNRIGAFRPLVGNSILSSDGEMWAHHRSTLRPHFHRDHVGDLDVFERHVQVLMKALPVAEGWTSVVDLQPLFHRLTMDASSEYFMGHDVGSQEAALRMKNNPAALHEGKDPGFPHALESSLNFVADAILLGDWHAFGITKEYRRLAKVCHSYVDGIIQVALRRPKGDSGSRRTLLEHLLEQTNDHVEIRNESLAILLAGRDTTAALLSFLVIMLAQHPHVFTKLRGQVLEHFGTFDNTKDISFSNLKACYYLQWCLNETLRLYPVFPVNVRRAVRDTSLPSGGGKDGRSPIFVPKGTEFFYDVHALHRVKNLWGQDAEDFKPERWDGRKIGFEYLAWSAGPRICIGQQLALTEAGYVAVRLLQRFNGLDGSSIRPGPVEMFMTTNITPLHGVKLRLREAGKV